MISCHESGKERRTGRVGEGIGRLQGGLFDPGQLIEYSSWGCKKYPFCFPFLDFNFERTAKDVLKMTELVMEPQLHVPWQVGCSPL